MENTELIHIGNQIHKKVNERNLKMKDLMLCFRCSRLKIIRMLNSSCLKTDLLMKWSLILDYDFFNFYTQEFLIKNQTVKNKINYEEELNI